MLSVLENWLNRNLPFPNYVDIGDAIFCVKYFLNLQNFYNVLRTDLCLNSLNSLQDLIDYYTFLSNHAQNNVFENYCEAVVNNCEIFRDVFNNHGVNFAFKVL